VRKVECRVAKVFVALIGNGELRPKGLGTAQAPYISLRGELSTELVTMPLLLTILLISLLSFC